MNDMNFGFGFPGMNEQTESNSKSSNTDTQQKEQNVQTNNTNSMQTNPVNNQQGEQSVQQPLNLQDDENFNNVMLEMDKTVKKKAEKKTTKSENKNTKKTNTDEDMYQPGTVVKIYGDELFTLEAPMNQDTIKEMLIRDFHYVELAEGKIIYDKVKHGGVTYLNITKSFNKNG